MSEQRAAKAPEEHCIHWAPADCPYCECDRLTRERDEARAVMESALEDQEKATDEAVKACRERDRLRAAIETYITECEKWDDKESIPRKGSVIQTFEAFQNLRRALEGEPKSQLCKTGGCDWWQEAECTDPVCQALRDDRAPSGPKD